MVTDQGGPLSRLAVVARECRIPLVVGTGEATDLIRDGDIVRVEGGEGIVDIWPTDRDLHRPCRGCRQLARVPVGERSDEHSHG
jgi:phosphoenolpyruvate-protein kinase (PTS system EI component)